MKALAVVAMLVYVLVSYRGIEGGTFQTLSDCLQYRHNLDAGGACLPVWPSGAIPAAPVQNDPTSTPQPLLSPADSGYVTSPPILGPGYNTGYGTVEQPSQPLWVVQFPL